MEFTKLNVRRLIEDIGNLPEPEVLKPVVILADQYDLRYIGKQEAKRMTFNEIESLLEYAHDYSKQYESGKFLYKTNRAGHEVADYEESEAYRAIRDSVAVLHIELKRRM